MARTHLATAIESMTDAVSITDATGRLTGFNPAFVKFHKFAGSEDCVHTLDRFSDLFEIFAADGELAPQDQWPVPRALRGETGADVEYGVRRKDTGETWVATYGYAPLRNAAGEITGTVAVGRDVTEQRRGEQRLAQVEQLMEAQIALVRSEEQFGLLAENITDVIWTMDLDTMRFTYFTPSVERLLGYTSLEAKTIGLDELLTSESLERARATISSGIEGAERGDTLGLHVTEVDQFRKDGSIVPTEVTTRFLPAPDGRPHMVLGITRDIAERKRAEEALRERQRQHETIIRTTLDGLLLTDAAGRVLEVNEAYCAMSGYSEQELLTMNIQDLEEMDAAEIASRMEKVASGVPDRFESRHRRKDGSLFDSEVSIRYEPTEGGWFAGFVRDITPRIKAETAMREDAERHQAILQTAMDGFCLVDMEGRLLEVNEAYTEMCGYSAQELLTMRIQDLVSSEHAGDVADHMKKVLADGHDRFESEHLRKDGSVFDIELSIQHRPVEGGQMAAFIRDITPRIEAEAALRDSQALLEESQRVARLGHYLLDLRTGMWASSAVLDDIFGIDDDFVRSTENWLQIVHPDDRDALIERLQQMQASGGQPGSESDYRIIRVADGAELSVHGRGSVEVDDRGEPVRAFGIIQDVTERKLTEQALLQSEERYRLLSETSPDLIFVIDSDDRVVYVNGAAARSLNGTAQEIIGRPREGLFEPRSSAKMGQALKAVFESGETLSHESQATYPGGEMWMKTTLVPMKDEEERIVSVFGVARDLTDHKRAEEAVVRSGKRLEGVLRSVVQTMGKVVEARDPYTQGHQKGVATIATLIARELGLPEDEVDGVEVAALVHDVGKLTVPAEILSKPGRLSDIELSLVKEHSQAGCDILKDIDFEWPVADIVLQHHERMDGSGYPNGVLGDEISMAARILMVADVIEAMAAHRPYRPALGLDAAIVEITGHPEQFDPQVVAACVRLFEAGRIEL